MDETRQERTMTTLWCRGGRRWAALAVVALVALALGVGVAMAARTVTVYAHANGKTINLKPGDKLVVRLAGNETTGYRWGIKSRPAALKLVSAKYVPSPPGRVGEGGVKTFRFVARSGSGDLKLVYKRSWEKKKPLKTFTLHIVVS